MQIVLCPYCRCAVLPQADGSCPACRRSIPLTSAEPLVIHHGPDAASQGSSSLPRPDASNSDDVSDAEGGFDHYEIPQFWTRLLQNTPSVVVTQAIIGINVVVFLLMAVDSGALFSPSSATLIRWGANFGPRTLDGQAWRLLTSTFVHIGVIHIGLNVWVLWSIGQLVERLTGNVGFLILYVLSGLFGSLASVYRNPTVLSAGASGAVFGAFGGLMGFVLLRGDSIPRGMLGSLRNSGLSFLFYNLIFGLSIPGIDMAAHAGGLAAGFVCGLVASQPLDRVSPLTRAWRNTAMLALGLAGLGLAWRAAPPAPIDLHAHLTHFEAVERSAVDAYNTALRRHQADDLSADELARVIETTVLPPWREIHAQFDSLDPQRLPVASRPTVERLRQYMALREEAWTAQANGLKDNDPQRLKEAVEKNEAADQLVRQLNNKDPK